LYIAFSSSEGEVVEKYDEYNRIESRIFLLVPVHDSGTLEHDVSSVRIHHLWLGVPSKVNDICELHAAIRVTKDRI
jgi:hypothetical protein